MTFVAAGQVYGLTDDNARALAMNVLTMKGCLEDYRLWAKEVTDVVDPVE